MNFKVNTVFWSVAAAMCVHASSVLALPFNDDMVNIQMKPGSVARGSVSGTVPLGSLAGRLEKKDDGESLVNPQRGDKLSTAQGERLFAVNCTPCHGDVRTTPYTPGPVAAKFMAPPDITSDYYRQKSDGYIYATIHFGGLAMMPAYGWKLSPSEHWDIINYLRSVQEAKSGAKK